MKKFISFKIDLLSVTYLLIFIIYFLFIFVTNVWAAPYKYVCIINGVVCKPTILTDKIEATRDCNRNCMDTARNVVSDAQDCTLVEATDGGCPSQDTQQTFGCLRSDGGCFDMTIYDLPLIKTIAGLRCKLACVNTAYTCNLENSNCADLKSLHSNFGCIHDVKCDDILNTDYTTAITKCIGTYGQKSETLAIPCPSKADWACFKETKCENVQAAFYQEAQSLCPNGEVAKEKISCEKSLSTDSALEEKYGPLAGTSLADLQEMAAKQLNQGNISEPTTLISRAINFLTGILGSIALLLYVVSGLLWMTARGASEQVDRAKKIMVWTTLGVVVTLFSYILTTMLFGFIPKLM